MNTAKYYTAGMAAYVIWGFFSFVLRPLAHYASLDILFYRVFFSLLLLILVSLARQKILRSNYWQYRELPRQDRRRVLLQILGGGIFLTGNWFSFIFVMNHVSINAASFAYLICPILTTLLAFVFLKDKLRLNQWLAVGLSIVSCLILSVNHLRDMFYSVLVALSFACYLVCQPAKGFDKLLILTLQVACAALLLAPFYPATHGAVPGEGRFYAYVLVIAVFFTIVPLWLNLYALKGLRSSALGILIYLNPLMNFGIAVGYYQERITAMQAVAYGMIFLSVIIFNFRPAGEAGKSSPSL